MDIPLPWERLLWSGRPAPAFARGICYALTDFRIVAARRPATRRDRAPRHRRHSPTRNALDRLAGASTHRSFSRATRRGRRSCCASVRRGAQLAALLDLLVGQPQSSLDADSVAAALAWEPRRTVERTRRGVVGTRRQRRDRCRGGRRPARRGRAGHATRPTIAICPGGQARPHAESSAFMEADVMPWARAALAPITGGADRVTCETCHGDERRGARIGRCPAWRRCRSPT